MAACTIDVRLDPRSDPAIFQVVLRAGNGETLHFVTMSSAVNARISGGHTPEDVIAAAFRFLLDREPKESILPRFDISVISRYFPEFERELPRYLATAGGERDA